MEWDSAPFESFKGTSVSHRRGWFNLSFFGRLSFILRFVYQILGDPKEVPVLVCIPKQFIEDTKNSANDSFIAKGSNEWVGSSDVLIAWGYKLVYGHRSPNDTTPVHIHFPINLRNSPIFPGHSTLSTPYVNNAALSVSVPPISVKTFRNESLGDIAIRFRRAILAYTADLAGMQSDICFRCSNPLKMLFPCPPGAEYRITTNWRSARFGEMDFSGAWHAPRVLTASMVRGQEWSL
ncbi:hypothetical protein C8R43DRAFT_516527 [Mycena crocata]|nr:hypothetical protein C8R43DRAFT_516527 [Mycena crocata]